MDGVIIVALTALLALIFRPASDAVGVDSSGLPIEQIQVNPRLNPSMVHDEHAFMKIANELGFH